MCSIIVIPQLLLGNSYKTFKTGGYSISEDCCQFSIQAKNDGFNFIDYAAYISGNNVTQSTNVTILGRKK